MIARASDGWALALWVGSRLLVLFAATVALGGAVTVAQHWVQWDAALLVEIAKFGYTGNPAHDPDPGLPGFLPGVPLLLNWVHLVVPDWAVAGLLISLVAGVVAVVALSRLGDLEFRLAGGHPTVTGIRGVGVRAVTFLVLSPFAVFLAAGYTEATFLALAIPAWLAGRKRWWVVAGVLAALATVVRVTGLFLAVALVVMYLQQGAEDDRAETARPSTLRTVGEAFALALPVVPVIAFSAYLHGLSGDWLAWLHAQQAGWGRTFTWPWDSARTTWNSALAGSFATAFRAELVAALVGVVLCLWLLYRRRWAELVYVGLQLGALMTSAYYLSITRATLLWWPLWLLLARVSLHRRWRWLLPAYAIVSTPLMAWYVSRFVHGAWAG